MRVLYSLAWWLALPLVLVRLWRRGATERGYRQHWAERLGFYGQSLTGQRILWVHAVSVGETRAAQPLIDALLAAYPDHAILLTHMTPTGRATGRARTMYIGQSLGGSNAFWSSEFWNQSIKDVWSVDASAPVYSAAFSGGIVLWTPNSS